MIVLLKVLKVLRLIVAIGQVILPILKDPENINLVFGEKKEHV